MIEYFVVAFVALVICGVSSPAVSLLEYSEP